MTDYAHAGPHACRQVLDTPPRPIALDGAPSVASRMPPLGLLEPVSWSVGTRLGMLDLRGYLVIGAIVLAVKAIQLRSV